MIKLMRNVYSVDIPCLKVIGPENLKSGDSIYIIQPSFVPT